MTYTEALEYTHSLLTFGIRPGLQRIKTLLDRLGNPQRQLQTVHVAGTNGKGSVCAMLASILQAAGYKTGLTISPYVLDFRERIQVNGAMITQTEFAALADEVKNASTGMTDPPTEFEFITTAAFLHFARSGCTLCVLETGLGGRLDATNVADHPLACVITPISLDHQAVLGNTVEAIAHEKCGIIKPGAAVVVSPDQSPQALGVILQAAAEQGNTVYMASLTGAHLLEEGMDGLRFSWCGTEYSLLLRGRHQLYNALTVLETVGVLRRAGMNLPDGAVKTGLAAVQFPARLERLNNDPLILLDGAHNPASAAVLRDFLMTARKNGQLPGPIIAVAGMLRDKDYAAVMALTAPLFDRLYATAPDNPRSLSAEDLATCAASHCPAMVLPDGPDALVRLLDTYRQGTVVIFGSLYLASSVRPEVLQWVKNRPMEQ